MSEKIITEGNITVGLVGDTSKLSPEAAKAWNDLQPSMRSFLKFLQSPEAKELEKKYREGAYPAVSHDWHEWISAMSLKDDVR